MPLEIQYVGVLIKSVLSEPELLKLSYLKLACIIVCVCVCAPYVGEPLRKYACPYHGHYMCKQKISRELVAQTTQSLFLAFAFFSHSSPQHGCLHHNFSDLNDLGV